MTNVVRDFQSNIFQHEQPMTPPRPIRVLHLIETPGPGGAERIFLDLAKNLGHEYHPILGLLRTGWVSSQGIMLGMPVVTINGGSLSDFSILFRLIRLVHMHEVALIHAHEFYMSVLGAVVSKLTGVPLIITVHGKNYYPERLRRQLMYRMAASQARAVVAVSGDLRMFFSKVTGFSAASMAVVYNGVDCARFRNLRRDPAILTSLGVPLDASIVGTVGNLYPVKGHTFLLQALKLILGRVPNTHVVILGRGELKESLTAQAEALGIRDRIHLVGFRDEVSPWLAVMDVYIMSSLHEGLPVSLLEAMAAALPVVVTSAGGMEELVRDGETGLVVKPADPNDLATKIMLFLNNPFLAKDLGRAAQAFVSEKFSLTRMVSDYCHLYREAIGGRHPLVAPPGSRQAPSMARPN